MLKTAKFGVKILGGGGCQKPTNQSQHMGSQCSGGTKLQPPLSTAMFYCYNLNYNNLTIYNKEHPPVGTQPQPFRSGTRIQKMLWNRETVKWNCRAFGSLKLGTKPVTQLAQQNLLTQWHRTIIRIRPLGSGIFNRWERWAQLIFRLVRDFRSRPFSLFLGSFLGAKRARFLTPFEVSM